MRGYRAIVSARFRTILQYRAAALAGLGTQVFWGLIRVMIFKAFYNSTTASQPMELVDVITYVWLGQAFLAMSPWNVDQDIRALIRTGGVSYELLRPLDLYGHWFSRAIAHRTAPTLLRAAPLLTLAALFFSMQAPPSWASAAAFVISMAGAVLLSSAITTLLNISLMWTISGDGIAAAMTAVVMLASGMLVPLPFFPDWAQRVLSALPFSGLVDTPYRLYLGHIPPGEVFLRLGHQLGWVVLLTVFGRWVLGRGLRRLVVQGG